MGKENVRRDIIHGNIYQLKLLMLFLYRGITRNYSFHLGTEIVEAKKFDDLVFKYTEGNNTFYRLLQAKHKLDENTKITASSLLKDGDFSLVKYFFSYHDMKEDRFFQDGSIESIVLCTNIDFDISDLRRNNINITKTQKSDLILDEQSSSQGSQKTPKRYQFNEDFVNVLTPIVKSYYPKNVVNRIVSSLLQGKIISTQSDIFQKYHKALSHEIIDVKNKKFYDQFITGVGLSPNAQQIRDYFEFEITRKSFGELNMANLNEELKKKSIINNQRIGLVVRRDFAKCDDHDWPTFNTIQNDVAEFIKHLVFAVQQLNEEELGETIKKELGNQFNEITTKHIYNNLFHRMLYFFQGKNVTPDKRFYSSEEGKRLINDARKEILSNLMSDYKVHMDSVPYKFKSNDELQKFVSSPKCLWLLSSETPWLASLFLHQDITNRENKFSYHNFKWIDLMENRTRVAEFINLDDFLLIVTCQELIDIKDITCAIISSFREILQQQNITFKKVIVIASENHEFMHQLAITFSGFYEEKLELDFKDLEDASLTQLLQKKNIFFRGNSTKESTSQLLCHEGQMLTRDQINKLNLDASALEPLLKDSDIKLSDDSFEMGDSSPEHLITDAFINFHELRETFVSRKTDIFAFHVEDRNILKMFLDTQVHLKRFSDIQFEIFHDRFILLNPKKEREEFNQLCHMVDNCICGIDSHVLHKIKYEGLKWIWMQTYSQCFYIPRLFKSVLIDESVKKLLIEETSSDFIVFSGMGEEKLLSFFNFNSRNEEENFKRNCTIRDSEECAERIFNDMTETTKDHEMHRSSITYGEEPQPLSVKTVHWIEAWVDDWQLKLNWKQSYGDVSKLRTFRSVQSPSLFLPEISLTQIKQRLVIFADEPGMGKSSTLVRFANLLKKENSRTITIKIDLNRYQDLFTTNSVNMKQNLIEMLLRFCQKSSYVPLMRCIIAYKLEFPAEVILLCDGFDEMDLVKQNAVLMWVKYVMKETKASIWITTRNNQKENLENVLCVLSYSFKPLNKVEIKDYLSKFWEISLVFSGESSHDFDFSKAAGLVANHFTPLFHTTFDNNFVHVPLVLRMLAETYVKVMEKVLIENIEDDQMLKTEIENIKPLNTYEAFVEHKYQIYFEKIGIRGALDRYSELTLRNAYSTAFGCLAAKEMQNKYIEKYINYECETVLCHSTLLRIGLVQIYGSSEIAFIHSSFSQYFATEFIYSKLVGSPNEEPLWNLLLNGILTHPFSRMLFDNKLKNSNHLIDLHNTRKQKAIVYQLLLAQVMSNDRKVALWEAAHDNYETTVEFLVKCVDNVTRLEILLQLPTYFLRECKNRSELLSICLIRGKLLCDTRYIHGILWHYKNVFSSNPDKESLEGRFYKLVVGKMWTYTNNPAFFLFPLFILTFLVGRILFVISKVYNLL